MQSEKTIQEIKEKYSDVSLKDILRMEFNEVLVSKDPIEGILEWIENGKMDIIIPEFKATIGFNQNNKWHNLTLDKHILKVVGSVKPDLELRLAALLHDISKPETYTEDDGVGHFYGHEPICGETANAILTRMGYEPDIIMNVSALVTHHHTGKAGTEKCCRRLVHAIGHELMYKMFKLMEADRIAHTPPHDFTDLDNLKLEYYKLLEKSKEFTVKDLKIDGNIIMSLGIKEGPRVGNFLNFLLDKVKENPKLNDPNILKDLVRNELSSTKWCIS